MTLPLRPLTTSARQGNVGKRTSMGHICGQTGAQGYRSAAVQIGVKHNLEFSNLQSE